MQKWFQQNKITKIGFEDVLYAISSENQFILINTLSPSDQDCLIQSTISLEEEETVINRLLKNNQQNQGIIVYGKNSCDEQMDKKHKQLSELGFRDVYIYYGGLFEWILLQDVYGNEFRTTTIPNDILKYRSKPLLKTLRITNGS